MGQVALMVNLMLLSTSPFHMIRRNWFSVVAYYNACLNNVIYNLKLISQQVEVQFEGWVKIFKTFCGMKFFCGIKFFCGMKFFCGLKFFLSRTSFYVAWSFLWGLKFFPRAKVGGEGQLPAALIYPHKSSWHFSSFNGTTVSQPSSCSGSSDIFWGFKFFWGM